MKGFVDDLEKKVLASKEAIAKQTTNAIEGQIKTIYIDSVESKDRENRKNNIIMFSVPESSTEEDEAKAKEILQKVSDKDIDIVSVSRLRTKKWDQTLPTESQTQRRERQVEGDFQISQPCPNDRIHEEGLYKKRYDKEREGEKSGPEKQSQGKNDEISAGCKWSRMDHKEKQSDKSYQGKEGPQIRDPSQKYGSDSLKLNKETQPDQEKECGQPRQ